MKTWQGIRTKLNGSMFVPLLALIGLFLSGYATAEALNNLKKKEQQETHFVLEKEHWHCFVGRLYDTGFECFVYKRKDADFGKFSDPRHGEHNKKQGASIHAFK